MRETPWAEWADRYSLIDTIPLTLPDEAAALAWLRVQLGKPYEWVAILGFALLRDWQDDRRWYCSELAAMAAIQGGLALRDRRRRIGVRLLREVAGGVGVARTIPRPARPPRSPQCVHAEPHRVWR